MHLLLAIFFALVMFVCYCVEQGIQIYWRYHEKTDVEAVRALYNRSSKRYDWMLTLRTYWDLPYEMREKSNDALMRKTWGDNYPKSRITCI